MGVKRGRVRLGVEAPPEVTVLREELQDRTPEWRKRELGLDDPAEESNLWQQLVRNRLQVAGLGLAALHRQLESGQIQDAEETLQRIEEDHQLLRQRLRSETNPALKRKPEAYKVPKALLVEDNANERELLATLLRRAGLQVDTAGDGSDALSYLHDRGRPDVVLLDMGLPSCDGPTTVREIRRDPTYAGLRIFAVSGHSPEEFDLDRGPAGIDRWFNKPVDLTALMHVLQQELVPA
jgi:CheY-like chemotaxis protein